MSTGFAQALRLLEQAWSHTRAGNYQGVVALLEPLSPAELLDEAELACLLAFAWHQMGRTDRGLQLLGAVETAWGARGNDTVRRMLLNNSGLLHYARGELDTAVRYLSELHEAATEAGDHSRIARACNNLGVIADIRGQSSEALALFARAQVAAGDAGDDIMVAMALNNLGISYRELGMLDDALAASDAGLAALGRGRDEGSLVQARIARALHHLAAGDLAMAEAVLNHATRHHERAGPRASDDELRLTRGKLLLAQRRDAEAVRVLQDAAEHVVSRKGSLIEPYVLAELAVALVRVNEPERGRAAAERAIALFRAMTIPARVEWTEARFAAELALPRSTPD